MSLNWDASECVDLPAIGVQCGPNMTQAQRIEWAKTEQIIFASMVTGLGKRWNIGAGDVCELFDRLSAYEHVIDGPVRFLSDDGERMEDCWLTLADIKARIGLRVNVSPVTRAAFERKLGQIALNQSADRRRYEGLSERQHSDASEGGR